MAAIALSLSDAREGHRSKWDGEDIAQQGAVEPYARRSMYTTKFVPTLAAPGFRITWLSCAPNVMAQRLLAHVRLGIPMRVRRSMGRQLVYTLGEMNVIDIRLDVLPTGLDAGAG